jgi:SAM-dependent methyltransferase
MRPVDTAELLDQHLLVCPACHGSLVARNDGLTCGPCERTYPIDDGIPVFVDRGLFDHDELDHLAGHEGHAEASTGTLHKAGQAAYFDREAMAEFEIERPAGTSSFYRFLLLEKFRRAIRPLGKRLDGWTALAVCGGSGMDAEFLVRTGASVISSDISLGAAKRTRERGRRHGLAIASIVADVEHLPFRDGSIDLVYVHDGLHHLEDPGIGLSEMARVAQRGLSITEPARAFLTEIAARFGLALEHEESGNLVARLDRASVARQLEGAGFSIIRSERYAMYYRHQPGRIFALMSRPSVLAITTRAWRAANVVIGPLGNKLAVVAERRHR